MRRVHTKQGISLFEVIVAVSVISVILISVVTALQAFLRAGLNEPERVQAVMLAEEGLEAVRFLRDQDWDTNISALTEGVVYYLVFSGTSWEATTPPQIINNVFTRTVSVEDVYRRDSDDDIRRGAGPLRGQGVRFGSGKLGASQKPGPRHSSAWQDHRRRTGGSLCRTS